MKREVQRAECKRFSNAESMREMGKLNKHFPLKTPLS